MGPRHQEEAVNMGYRSQKHPREPPESCQLCILHLEPGRGEKEKQMRPGKAAKMEVIVAAPQEANKCLHSALLTCYNCGQVGHMGWSCPKGQG